MIHCNSQYTTNMSKQLDLPPINVDKIPHFHFEYLYPNCMRIVNLTPDQVIYENGILRRVTSSDHELKI